MKRPSPIFGVDWPGSLKRQAVKDSHEDHEDMASQSTSAPSASSSSSLSHFSMFSQEEVLSHTVLLVKDEISWTLQELGEHGDVKQEELEELADATVSGCEADVKQEKLEEKEDKHELQNSDQPSVQDVAQKSTEGQPQQIRKKDLTGADILERLKTGHFAALARSLEGEIGIKDETWERLEFLSD